MENFVNAILTGRKEFILTSVADSLDSHLLAFAAEASRRTGQTVNMADFEGALREENLQTPADEVASPPAIPE
jgi:hypothetical protein